MRILAINDEKKMLLSLADSIHRVIPNAIVYSFRKCSEVLRFMDNDKFDVAFLDVKLMDTKSGIDLGKSLLEKNPDINIIYCDGYSKEDSEAINMRCSGFISDNITDDAIKYEFEHLRFPLTENGIKKLKVKCFGNFEVYLDDLPMKFTCAKTKELFAYLIDRHGSLCTNKEIQTALWGDGKPHESYMKKIRGELQKRLSENNLDDVLIVRHGSLAININKISCDYYDYLDGKNNLYAGEYMTQYTWSKDTNIKANIIYDKPQYI